MAELENNAGISENNSKIQPTTTRRHIRRKIIKKRIKRKTPIKDGTTDPCNVENTEDGTTKLICRLPLSRLTGILESLPPSKGLLSTTIPNRYLCLYCERTFPNHNLQIKHIDKVHKLSKNRRASVRYKFQSSGKLKIFPNCSFCNKQTGNKLKISIPATSSDDLLLLFKHLVHVHSDQYYACEICMIRFSSISTKTDHFSAVHKKTLLTKNDDTPEETRSIRTTRSFMKNNSTDDKVLLEADEPMLSRLGITQNRLPKNAIKKRAVKQPSVTRKKANESPILDNHYNKITKLKTIRSTINNQGVPLETNDFVSKIKTDPTGTTFDEDFYETVNLNVRNNLCHFIDGKLEDSPVTLNPVIHEPAIRSTVVKSPIVSESKIYEATNISSMTVFPTLLTVDQYGAEIVQTIKFKKPITKHSWKWKWDYIKKFKYVNENGKIVKKFKQQNVGLRDLSKLDMWTQLAMRSKHEIYRSQNMVSNTNSLPNVGEVAREQQRRMVEQLNKILDTRLLPPINIEQQEACDYWQPMRIPVDHTIVKQEVEDIEEVEEFSEYNTDSFQQNDDFPYKLQLTKNDGAKQSTTIVLSGEWARPRCYVCYGCGDKFDSFKLMVEHRAFKHPYVYSTHYEIVGKELMEKQLYRHFFIPLTAFSLSSMKFQQPLSIKMENNSEKQVVLYNDSGSNSDNYSATPTDIDIYHQEKTVICSKCKKECINMMTLYSHMLTCSGDYVWIQAKKRMKYRRARRRRVHRSSAMGKKFNKTPTKTVADDEDSPVKETAKKPKTSTPKPKDSDKDIVQRLLANLPAKRVSKQILQNTKQPKRNVKKKIGSSPSEPTMSPKKSRTATIKQNPKQVKGNTARIIKNRKIDLAVIDRRKKPISINDKKIKLNEKIDSRKVIRKKSVITKKRTLRSRKILHDKELTDTTEPEPEPEHGPEPDPQPGPESVIANEFDMPENTTKNSTEVSEVLSLVKDVILLSGAIEEQKTSPIEVESKDTSLDVIQLDTNQKNNEIIKEIVVEEKCDPEPINETALITSLVENEEITRTDTHKEITNKSFDESLKTQEIITKEIPNKSFNESLKTPETITASAAPCSSTPITSKKKVKKLNDCIAMLTGKLQEKLGVNFFDDASSVLLLRKSDEAKNTIPIRDGLTSDTRGLVDTETKNIDQVMDKYEKSRVQKYQEGPALLASKLEVERSLIADNDPKTYVKEHKVDVIKSNIMDNVNAVVKLDEKGSKFLNNEFNVAKIEETKSKNMDKQYSIAEFKETGSRILNKEFTIAELEKMKSKNIDKQHLVAELNEKRSKNLDKEQKLAELHLMRSQSKENKFVELEMESKNLIKEQLVAELDDKESKNLDIEQKLTEFHVMRNPGIEHKVAEFEKKSNNPGKEHLVSELEGKQSINLEYFVAKSNENSSKTLENYHSFSELNKSGIEKQQKTSTFVKLDENMSKVLNAEYNENKSKIIENDNSATEIDKTKLSLEKTHIVTNLDENMFETQEKEYRAAEFNEQKSRKMNKAQTIAELKKNKTKILEKEQTVSDPYKKESKILDQELVEKPLRNIVKEHNIAELEEKGPNNNQMEHVVAKLQDKEVSELDDREHNVYELVQQEPINLVKVRKVTETKKNKVQNLKEQLISKFDEKESSNMAEEHNITEFKAPKPRKLNKTQTVTELKKNKIKNMEKEPTVAEFYAKGSEIQDQELKAAELVEKASRNKVEEHAIAELDEKGPNNNQIEHLVVKLDVMQEKCQIDSELNDKVHKVAKLIQKEPVNLVKGRKVTESKKSKAKNLKEERLIAELDEKESETNDTCHTVAELKKRKPKIMNKGQEVAELVETVKILDKIAKPKRNVKKQLVEKESKSPKISEKGEINVGKRRKIAESKKSKAKNLDIVEKVAESVNNESRNMVQEDQVAELVETEFKNLDKNILLHNLSANNEDDIILSKIKEKDKVIQEEKGKSTEKEIEKKTLTTKPNNDKNFVEADSSQEICKTSLQKDNNEVLSIAEETTVVELNKATEIIAEMPIEIKIKVKKKRKNELTKILSDQLLESFKEVDKSSLDNIKILHDLSLDQEIANVSVSQIPQLARRKTNPVIFATPTRRKPAAKTVVLLEKKNEPSTSWPKPGSSVSPKKRSFTRRNSFDLDSLMALNVSKVVEKGRLKVASPNHDHVLMELSNENKANENSDVVESDKIPIIVENMSSDKQQDSTNITKKHDGRKKALPKNNAKQNVDRPSVNKKTIVKAKNKLSENQVILDVDNTVTLVKKRVKAPKGKANIPKSAKEKKELILLVNDKKPDSLITESGNDADEILEKADNLMGSLSDDKQNKDTNILIAMQKPTPKKRKTKAKAVKTNENNQNDLLTNLSLTNDVSTQITSIENPAVDNLETLVENVKKRKPQKTKTIAAKNTTDTIINIEQKPKNKRISKKGKIVNHVNETTLETDDSTSKILEDGMDSISLLDVLPENDPSTPKTKAVRITKKSEIPEATQLKEDICTNLFEFKDNEEEVAANNMPIAKSKVSKNSRKSPRSLKQMVVEEKKCNDKKEESAKCSEIIPLEVVDKITQACPEPPNNELNISIATEPSEKLPNASIFDNIFGKIQNNEALNSTLDKRLKRNDSVFSACEDISFIDENLHSNKITDIVEDILKQTESESDSDDDDNMSLACFVRQTNKTIPEIPSESNTTVDPVDLEGDDPAVVIVKKNIKRKKRRKSMAIRRPKPQIDVNKPIQTFTCDLCKKVFRKVDALNKHKITLSHIAKLSEHEFLMSTLEKEKQEKLKQEDDIPKTELQIKELSQEEKLFLECCSMLKESTANKSEAKQQAQSEMLSVKPESVKLLTKTSSNCIENSLFTGDTFTSNQDAAENENYMRTISSRYSDKMFEDNNKTATPSSIEDGGNSPHPSIKSTSSHTSIFSLSSKIKTKGALKGYDNFNLIESDDGPKMVETKYEIESNLKDEEQVTGETLKQPKKTNKKNDNKSDQGNKLGFRAKKRNVQKGKKKSLQGLGNLESDRTEDIYTFKDSPNSAQLSSYSSKKPSYKTVDNTNEESQISSLSFSDRDDYVYGTGNMSEDEDDDKSSFSSLTNTKKTGKAADIKKKSLIMGRIFKRKETKEIVETVVKNEDVKTERSPQDFDKLFDTLKKTNESAAAECKGEVSDEAINLNDNKPVNLDPNTRKSKRRCSRQKTLCETWDSDEYEDFNMDADVLGLIEKADGKKAKKQPTLNEIKINEKVVEPNEKPSNNKVFIEEKADIPEKLIVIEEAVLPENIEVSCCNSEAILKEENTTKDENLLIQSKELEIKKVANKKKKKTSRKSQEQKQPNKITNKKVGNKPNAKQRKGTGKPVKKMKNVAYDPDSDFEDNIKAKKIKKDVQENELENELKLVEILSKNENLNNLFKTPRRKRVASDMLYYWSSSSSSTSEENDEDENNKDENGSNSLDHEPSNDSPAVQHQACAFSEAVRVPVQHGWIVGDSHKKLVTLLAHAKGKKTDDNGVKETLSRRKT